MRRLSLIMSALVALPAAVLSGCGGGDDPNRIVIWQQMDPEERNVFAELESAYEREHPELTFEVSHYATEDLRTQYQTAALAGGGPDLVFGPSDQVGPFSVMGIIHPIDEVIGADELARFVPQSFDTLDGHIWALPDQLGNHLTLVWNRDLIDRAPATMNELIEIARSATVDDNGDGTPDQYGLVFEVTEPFWTIPFLTGYGGWVMDRESRPTLDTGAMVRALELIRAFRFDYRVMPSECDYELSDTMFKEGRAAMIINGPWSWEAYRKAGINVGLARIPFIEETGRWPAPMVSSKGYSINQRVKGDKLRNVLAVLEYLTSIDCQKTYATRLGTLPTRKAAYDEPAIADDPTLAASRAQVEVGRRMPVVPEMRAIWDAMRPAVQSVYNGAMSPEEAARSMQEIAVVKIREMKG